MASITAKQVLAATVVYSIARGVSDELRPTEEGSEAEKSVDTEVFNKVMGAMCVCQENKRRN